MINTVDDKVSILIVDDNSVNRQVLTFILQDHYLNLQTADDGVQCLGALQSQHFDLVLLDLNMPLKSGFDVLEEIQSNKLYHRPAFIVVSADNNPTTISRALKLGASDYVTTPFNRDELMARVRTHLALHSREQDLEDRVRTRTAELETANRELKETQSQLILAAKMASLGQLSAGIAHEINNPIGYIRSNMTTLEDYTDQIAKLLRLYSDAEKHISDPTALEAIRQYKDKIQLEFLKEDVPQLITDSLTGAQRVKDIATDLKVFSHPEQHNWEALDLRECFNSVLNIVNSEVKYKAEIQLQVADEVPSIECITPQIYQVMTNLLVNAAQSIEGHGTIDIQVSLPIRPHNRVKVVISDTGSGMSEEVASRIFDPFFTTKAVGEGTGLGLAVTYGIIEGHSGHIHVSSTLGEGTSFTVLLPITQKQVKEQVASKA
ncbi:MAG: response regulator [Cellvibrionaceae bacterium]